MKNLISLILGLIGGLSFSVLAQTDYPLESQEVEVRVQELGLIGKKVINQCNRVNINQICEDKLKQILNIRNISHINIVKPGMKYMFEYSPNRINILLNKEQHIIKVAIG